MGNMVLDNKDMVDKSKVLDNKFDNQDDKRNLFHLYNCKHYTTAVFPNAFPLLKLQYDNSI